MLIFPRADSATSIKAFAAAAAAGGGYAPAELAIIAQARKRLEELLDAAEAAAIQRHDEEAAARATPDWDGQIGPGPARFDRLYRSGDLVAAAYGGGRSRVVISIGDCGDCRVAVECDSIVERVGISPLFAARVAAAEAILGKGVTGEGRPSPFAR